METTKKRTVFKALAVGLCIPLLLSLLWGCTAPGMYADMGGLAVEDMYYDDGLVEWDTIWYAAPGEETRQPYSFNFESIASQNDSYRAAYEGAGGTTLFGINATYAVIICKTDLMFRYRLHRHVGDLLISFDALNHTAKALYQTEAAEKILYGTREYVPVYSAPHNTYRYISIEDGAMLGEIPSHIDPLWGDYSFRILEAEGVVEVEKIDTVCLEDGTRLIDSIPLCMN